MFCFTLVTNKIGLIFNPIKGKIKSRVLRISKMFNQPSLTNVIAQCQWLKLFVIRLVNQWDLWEGHGGKPGRAATGFYCCGNSSKC